MEYINFHCHNAIQQQNVIAVQSLSVDEFDITKGYKYTTVGIHPWNTNLDEASEKLNKVRNICGEQNVIGIGEIGLDRLKGAPLKEQEIIFEEQIKIALEFNKPIIIHCVRAWNELLVITSKYPTLKKAVHGFRQKPEIARQLVDKGFYISFGVHLIDSASELSEVLRLVPTSRMFLETDTSEIPIKEVYMAACRILNVSLEQLASQIRTNFEEFYQL